MNELKQKIEELTAEIESACNKAYQLGYKDGLGVVLPSQQEFNVIHKSVSPYGEEHEWLVLSNEYSYDEAYKLFKKYLSRDMDEEWLESCLESISGREISYKVPEGEEEPTFWCSMNGKGFFKAWVMETGY